jgi:hypothetical protein
MANLIHNLDKGEKLLAANKRADEDVVVKLLGNFGQAIVITTKRVYIIKWGFMTGNTFGGKCIAFELRSITGLQIEMSFLSPGILKVLTPATQDNSRLSYWDTSNSKNNADQSDNGSCQ